MLELFYLESVATQQSLPGSPSAHLKHADFRFLTTIMFYCLFQRFALMDVVILVNFKYSTFTLLELDNGKIRY